MSILYTCPLCARALVSLINGCMSIDGDVTINSDIPPRNGDWLSMSITCTTHSIPLTAQQGTKRTVNVHFVGNTGVGKSHLANCFLGQDKFKSHESATSVTRELEVAEKEDSKIKYRVHNIPGLLEDDDKRVEQNVAVLKKAFEQKDDSVVFFVLSLEGGRIRSSDIGAYRALERAYKMTDKNFTFIVNKWKSRGVTQEEVAQRIKTVCANREVNFIPELAGDFKQDMSTINPALVTIVGRLTPVSLEKKAEIQLESEELKARKEELKRTQEAYERSVREREAAQARMIAEQQRQVQEACDRMRRQRKREQRVVRGIVTLGLSELFR